MKKKSIYPGIDEVEKERSKAASKYADDTRPDFIGNAPNYDKFKNWPVENVLAWLNID